MEQGVFARNGQTEAGTTGFTDARGVGSPEPVEDVFRLFGTQPDTPIGHLDRDGVIATHNLDAHGIAFRMF